MISLIRTKLGRGKARLLSFLYWVAFGLALWIVAFSILLASTNHQALAAASPWPVRADGLPDFSQVTPDNFAVFSRDQCFAMPAAAAHLVEGDNLCVKAGDKFSSLPLSILNTFSQVGNETVIESLSKGGIDPATVRLDRLPFLAKANAQELFKSLNIADQPVSAVLKQELTASGRTFSFSSRSGLTTNQQVFNAFPDIAHNPLQHVGSLAMPSLEGLDTIALKNITKALAQPINQYPGLKDRALSSFPQPPALPAVPIFGKADKVRLQENLSARISTGSLQERSIPCPDSKQCNGFEFSELVKGTLVGGTIAVSGDSQATNSGFGFLGGLNIGREPTGDFPLGEIFKESYHNFSSDGKADRALNFRICDRGGFLRPDLGCSKYFIGPIIYGQLSESGHEALLIGNPQLSTALLSPKPTAETVTPAPVASVTNPSSSTTTIGGVDMNKLSLAIKNTGISTDLTQVKSLLSSATAANPTLSSSTLLRQIAMELFAGSNANTLATNPVSGDSAIDFADQVATAYAAAT